MTPTYVSDRGPFEEVAGEQLAATVDQLLVAYNVQEPDVWAPIITRLADEAASMLSPARAVAYGNLDPRFYIKVGINDRCITSLCRADLMFSSAPILH